MAFGGFLRQSTAVDILIGPFVDSDDGKTAETGLTLDVEVSKNGQALANKNDNTTPVHDAAGTVDGYYNCELDTTDTNTVGQLTVVAHDSGALPVRHEYQIVEEVVYDTFYASGAIAEPMLNTTVGATVTSATVFNLTAGVGNNDAYIDATICVMDNSNSDLAEWRTIVDYVGSTKTVTLDRALSFTPEASTDEVIIKGKTRNNSVAGGTSVTYTVTDDGTSGGNAVPDVHVWVTIDSGGNTIVASGDTDSSGQITVYLDLGSTYYFWKHKAGFTFESQPESYTVV